MTTAWRTAVLRCTRRTTTGEFFAVISNLKEKGSVKFGFAVFFGAGCLTVGLAPGNLDYV